MFTGIITHIGTLKTIRKSGDWRLVIAVPDFTDDLSMGASVACSGVCLTVIDKSKNDFTVQVSGETLSRTTIGQWEEGTRINLERALRMGDELGGHMVSGHVDALAVVEKIRKTGESKEMWLRHCKQATPAKQSSAGLPRSRSLAMTENLIRFIAPKGSVTLDGVSLTVNNVSKNSFSVNIIPHTAVATTLSALRAGDAVNLEIDLIARYLARMKGK